LVSIGVKKHHEAISNGFIVIGVMAVGLGLVNLVGAHGARFVFKRPGWFNSLALLLGLVSMLAVTAGQWWSGVVASYEIRDVQMMGEFSSRIAADATSATTPVAVPELGVRVSSLLSYSSEKLSAISRNQSSRSDVPKDDSIRDLNQELNTALQAAQQSLDRVAATEFKQFDQQNGAVLENFTNAANRVAGAYSSLKQSEQSQTLTYRLYALLYTGLFNQLGSAMFALLGVYIAAAAYRAFRVKTFESALMMISAVIVMLGQISAVFLLVGPEWFGQAAYAALPSARQWLLEVPNSAAFRAIRLGAGVAGLMLAIRMWLSIESRSFGARKGS
jgi:hypothetical protein